MSDRNARVLLIEDNPGDARLIEIYLSEADSISGSIFRAPTLTKALELVPRVNPDVVLLDLSLPDAQGLDALYKVKEACPELPVVILTGMQDADLGPRAVRRGAQDYLSKDAINGPLLGKALRYAIERNHLRLETERLQAELIQRRRLADVGQTVAGISHYIKNVLMRMHVSSEMIAKRLEEGHDEDLARLWPIFSRATDELNHYVLKMLDFSRNEQLDLEPVDPNELAEEIVRLCNPDAQNYSLRLTADTDPGVPPVKADSERLKDAVLNLVSNAIEACEGSEGAEITVSTAWRDGDPNATISVIDTGPGVPDDAKAHIFEPYFTTKAKHGNGIGLALVQKIVLAHEGRIRMSSVPGRTVFEIAIPVASGIDTPPAAVAGAAPSAPPPVS